MTMLERKPGWRDAAIDPRNVDPERKAPEERHGTFNPGARGSTPPGSIQESAANGAFASRGPLRSRPGGNVGGNTSAAGP